MDRQFLEDQLTLNLFGYLPKDLSKGSHKRVVARCEFCLCTFEAVFKNLFRNPRAVVCSKCSAVSKTYFANESSENRHEYWKSRQPTLGLSFIDIEATKKMNGGLEVDFSRKSQTRIVARCEFCLCNFETSLSSLHSSQKHVCCKLCSGIASKYGNMSGGRSKHEFYVDRMSRQGNVNIGGLSSGSDKVASVKCDFCLKEFSKRAKYVDYVHGSIVCRMCSGTAAAYYKEDRSESPNSFWGWMHPKAPSSLDVIGTKLKFGHDPTFFGRGSGKKVVVKCCFCQASTDTSYSYWVKKGFEKSCSSCKYKKNIQTMIERYGVSSVLEIPGVKQKASNPLTERIVETILRDRYKIEFVRGYEIPLVDGKSYTFDFYIPSLKLLIECQGDYFHDFKQNGYSGTPKDRAKATWVETHTDLKLLHVWEHEIHIGRVSKILSRHIGSALEPKLSIPSLKQIEFKRIQDADAHKFLSMFHYLGNLGTISTCYGGFLGEDLVCVGTFGGTTRQNTFKKVKSFTGASFGTKQLKELRRFCIRPNVEAKRMASYCIRKFVAMFVADFPSTKAVISFADPTVGDSGSIYKYAGWSELPDTGKSYHYADPETCKMIHKKTVWDLAKAAHMSEDVFAEQSGLIKVSEMSKRVWLKLLSGVNT